MHGTDTQLLCTFSSANTYRQDIDELEKFYTIDGGKIYILKHLDNLAEIFLTYNVIKNGGKHFPRTISVHRKKDYNILYSINALNELIKEENNGVFSQTHQLDWSRYSDSIIVVNGGKIKVMPTKLLKVFLL